MGVKDMKTVSQAALILNCSVRTIRRRIKDGSLKAYYISGKVYISDEDIQQYLSSRLIKTN